MVLDAPQRGENRVSRTPQQKALEALPAASGDPEASMASTARAAAPSQSRAVRRSVDQWLMNRLEAGPVKVREIAIAAQAAGMSMRTVERAKRRLGIKADRSGKGWCWSLPQDRHDEQATPATSAAQPSSVASGPPFSLGLVRSRYGSIEPPRVVPLWAAMGRKRLS